MNGIREMLNPQSIALIGASEKEGSIGRTVFTNLLSKKDASLFPVNPTRQAVLGVPCFSAIKDVPLPVSLAVIATPAPGIADLVRECGEAGVRGVIILSSYYINEDSRTKALERAIIDTRRNYGMRTIGPNCLGVILPHIGLNATFLATNPKPGKIALVSRALGDAMLEWGEDMGIGFSMFASLGSMIDVGFGDMIDFLNDDRHTRSLMIHMETVGDAGRFVSAARGFALTKPVVVLRPGRSEAGARFVKARAGRNIGDDAVYDAVFSRLGLVRVREAAALFNMAKVLDSRRFPMGPRIAIITSAGDMGIMATDTLAGLGGKLAAISTGSADGNDLLSPERWSREYPIDLRGGADVGRYVSTVKACMKDEKVDGILVIYTPLAGTDAIVIAKAIAQVSRNSKKPVIAVWMGGEPAAKGRRILLRSGIPAYATPEEAVRTYLYMYRYRRNIQLLYETPAEQTQTNPPLKNYLKAIVRDAIGGGNRTIGAEASLELLKNYSIRTVPTAVVANANYLRATVREIGLPLTLRVRHTRDGGEERVILLTTGEEADQACEDVGREFTGEGPESMSDAEFIVQKAADPGAPRLKLESKRDPEFRTILILGPYPAARHPGIALPPLNKTLVKRFLEDAGVYKGKGVCEAGQQALERLEDIILCFSNLVVDFGEIERAELALSVGESDVLVTDASFTLAREQNEQVPYAHLVIRPYPSHYMTRWKLPDGTGVLLKPIRPEDESTGRDMLAALSKEAAPARFFGAPKITHDLLVRFCNIDYDREIAINAEIEKDGKKRIIGGCRLVLQPGSNKAEFAILVHDDYRRMGLGAKLIDVLIGIAGEKRLEEIYGEVPRENQGMIGLCRKLGFSVKSEPHGGSIVSLLLTPA